MGIFLVKRNEDDVCSTIHGKKRHNVICTVGIIADLCIGPSRNKSWGWEKFFTGEISGGFILRFWNGLKVFNDHVSFDLPDGYTAGVEHFNSCTICDCTDAERDTCNPYKEKGDKQPLAWEVFKDATWFSLSPIPKWILEGNEKGYFNVQPPNDELIDELLSIYDEHEIKLPKKRILGSWEDETDGNN